MHLENYIPLLRYPSIERISTLNDAPDAFDGSRAINILTPGSVKLLWSMLSPTALKSLLAACGNLKRFDFILPNYYRYKWSWDVGYDAQVAPRELATVLLELHGLTLRTLFLDFHHFYSLRDPEIFNEVGDEEDDDDYTYPSFRDCENLEYITIEFEKLVKFCHLPASLKSLHLDWCYFSDIDMDYVRELIKLKETWCPAIESVLVSGWDKNHEGIAAVRDHARLLEAPAHLSEDGCTLQFFGEASFLRMQSLNSEGFEAWEWGGYADEEEEENAANEEERIEAERRNREEAERRRHKYQRRVDANDRLRLDTAS